MTRYQKLLHLKFCFVITAIILSNTLVHAESLALQYRLPPLERIVLTEDKFGIAAKQLLEQARVLKRAREVNITFERIEDPIAYTEKLRMDIQAQLPTVPNVPLHLFTGEKTSELNQLLNTLPAPRRIIVQAVNLEVDEILKIPADTTLDGRNVTLIATTPHSPAILLSGKNIILSDLTVETAGLAVQISDAQKIKLHHLTVTEAERGIAIGKNSQFIELDQIMLNNNKAGILIQQAVSHIWLHHSAISNSLRADNGGAGLLASDAQWQENLEDSTRSSALTEAIYPPPPAPHALLIENNEFRRNVAQGIYFDGVFGSVVRGNQVIENDKEGLCLDFGSVNNIVIENNFINNGQRARQTDKDLSDDWVLNFGRLVDGSSVSKLPGIALDNAAQNLILWNTIRNNAGDGIKIVRTGIRNLFLSNIIVSNNQGSNSRFHFFGILLGGAKLEPGIDPTNHPLDFLPPLENIVAGNSIYGGHWSGILLDQDAAFNDIYDNTVHHFVNHPLESATQQPNSIIGNSWQPPPQSFWEKFKACLKGLLFWKN